ncbi:MAG: isopeptide-forming domain-containing fimbrial protein [Marinicellaceae bacterium]
MNKNTNQFFQHKIELKVFKIYLYLLSFFILLQSNSQVTAQTFVGTTSPSSMALALSPEDVKPTGSIEIDLAKTVEIILDGGNIGVADPGDTLEYTIVLTNGSSTVNNVVLDDLIPNNTTYVAASLSTTPNGTAIDAGDPNLQVTLANMNPLAVETITFRVTIDGGTPFGSVISNQAFVDADETVSEPSDSDGIDSNGDQPTEITVGGPSSVTNGLYVQKLVDWVNDADASDDVTAGDVMRYTLIIENQGDETLTNVSITDTLPAGLTFVGASETITGVGNSIAVVSNNLTINIATLNTKNTQSAVFEVTIDAFAGTTRAYLNQAIIDSDQTDPNTSDNNGDANDGNQSTRFVAVNGIAGSATVDMEKRWSHALDVDGDGLVDTGETIVYTITVLNTGSDTATNLILSDTIPTDTTIVTGSASTSGGMLISEDPVSVNIGDLNPGSLVTVQFSVTIDGGTPDGSIIANQATVIGDGGIIESSDDNGVDNDGKNPTLTTIDTGGGSGSPTGLSKNLLASSEADSFSNNVLIGEVLTFRIAFNVPAGLVSEVTLGDTLPSGLSYFPGSGRLARNFDTGLSSSENPGSINSAASGVFVAVTDDTDLVVDDQVVSLFLGNLINSDNDFDAESFVLEIQAIVDNDAGNNAGMSMINQGTLSFQSLLGQTQNLTPDTIPLTIIEPELSIDISAGPAAIFGMGGTVAYTVSITNPNSGFNAAAYDINITNALPAAFTGLSIDSITPAGGVSGVTDNSAGSNVVINVANFPTGGSLTVVYSASAAGPLADGVINNTATVNWTSLPGTRGTGSVTPGDSGDIDGERDSSGGSNDLTANDTAVVAVGSVNLTKSILNPQTRYAIGDLVNYQVEISVPRSLVTNNTVLADVLDEGLTYQTGSLNRVYDLGLISSLNPTEFNRSDNTPSAGFETLTLNLGTLINNNASTATVTFTYNALVDNIIENQDGEMLVNNVSLDLDSPGGAGRVQFTDNTSVTLGEPVLSLVKNITSSTPRLSAGSEVTYSLAIANTGTTTAFETIITDVLPAGLENINALTITSSSGGAETPTFTNNGFDWISSGFDLPVGAMVTIEFNAELSNTVIPGQTIQNTATTSYDSRDGADANQRDGSGGINDYTISANSPTFTVDDPFHIDKIFYSDAADTTYTLGETVTWRLTLSFIEGTSENVVVTDTLPDGVRFTSASVGVGNMGITQDFTAETLVGQVLTFDFGDIVNPGNAVDNDDFITIDISAVVENELSNVDGAQLGNNADVSFTGASGMTTINYDFDNATPGIQPRDLSVVEPNITITKSADITSLPPGDTVTFSLLLDHSVNSTSDGYDLIVVDTLPIGLSYVPVSASVTPVINGQQLTFNISALTLINDQTTITYRANIDANVALGDPLTNTVDLSYSSQPGINTDERSYSDTDSETITPATSTFIEADKTVSIFNDGGTSGQVDAGDTLLYNITLENMGNDATNVLFSDDIPTNTTYVPGSLTTDLGTIDDSGDPLTVNMSALAGTARVNISFRVTIDAGTAPGTVISNQGEVDSNETLAEPTDSDGVDSNGDQATEIIVGGLPSIANPLYVEKTVSWISDTDSSLDITPGDSMRYTFIFKNTGATALNNVTLTDTIPTGLSFINASETISGGFSINVIGANISVAITNIASGDVVVASLDITIDGPPLFNNDGSAMIEVFTNQAQADSDETTPVLSDSNGDRTDGNQSTRFTAVEGIAGTPELDIEKRWSLSTDLDGDGLVDPNDTIEYRITLINSGSARADNVFLNDSIPVNSTLVPGSVTTSQGIVAAQDPISINFFDIDPGTVIVVTFLVNIDGGTADGTIISNQAMISGDNFSSENSDDNGNDSDGKNPTLTPIDTGSSSGLPTSLVKTISGSSETHTSFSTLAIGELVTFQVEVSLPVGSTNQVKMTDELPTGLKYLAGSATLARVFDTGLVAAANPSDINSAASGVPVDLIDGSSVIITGQNISLFLGDVINSDNDSSTERYRLSYQAIVENIPGNDTGTRLNNSASVSYLDALLQTRSLTPVTATVNLVEPNLVITKSAQPSAILPSGGDVSFTLTVTNPSNGNTADAFDVQIIDSLPAQWTGLVVDSITPSGGVSGITDNSVSTSLNIDVASFPIDGQLTIVMTANTTGPLMPASVITNTATVTWTSLPGLQGTGNLTPGNSGDTNGERNSGSGSNDYSQSDSATVVVDSMNFTKTILNAQTRYAIGDQVEYQLQIGLPATLAVTSVVLEDILPEGLTLVNGTLNIDLPAGVTAGATPIDFDRMNNTPLAGQETLGLNVVSLTNNNPTSQTVTLTYNALVDNLFINQENQSLTNQASLGFDNPGGGARVTLSDNSVMTVGEPELTLTQSIISPTTGLDAGDNIIYQLIIGNTGMLTAYDVILNNILPIGLENVTEITLAASSGGAEIPTFTNNGSDWASSPFDVPVGAMMTITFNTELTDKVTPSLIIQNTVSAEFSSVDGINSNERDGSDGVNGVLNDYALIANSPSITMDNPVQLDKTFHTDATNNIYTIGETVTWRLTIDILEGTLEDLIVIDDLPNNVRFTKATVGSGNLGIGHDFTAPTQTGQTLSFDLGTVVNPADGNSLNDFLTIDISAVIEDFIPSNVAGQLLGNNAALSFTPFGGGSILVNFDADNSSPGIQPLNLTIVEPIVTITKSADRNALPPGDMVTFTILIDHDMNSSSAAFDLEIVDTLPTGLTFVNAPGSPAPIVVDQVLTFNISTLTLLDNQISITYNAMVDPEASVGIGLINNAVLTYSSQPGINADERIYNDSDSETIVPGEQTHIEAIKSVELSTDGDNLGFIDPGDTLTYTITLENLGSNAQNVVFTDTLPSETTYVANSLTSSLGTIDDNNAPDLLVTINELTSENIVTITFSVTVNNDIINGTVITNQGSVDSDQTLPELTDSDSFDDNGDQPTEVTVGEQLIIISDLYVEKSVSLISDKDISGNFTSGDILAYNFVIHNLGSTELSDVTLNDIIPAGLTAVVGSESVSGSGALIKIAGATVSVSIPIIEAGVTENASFQFRIDDPLFDGDGIVNSETFINQAIANSDQTQSILSDGNGDQMDGNQPTSFTAVAGISGAPVLDVEKRWTLTDDFDDDNLVNPGDQLTYTISLRNTGSAFADNVILNDAIPNLTSIVAGSVLTTQGIVISENPVSVNISDIEPGNVVIITFSVIVDADAPNGSIIINQAIVSGNNFSDEYSDDNGNDSDGKNPNLTEVVDTVVDLVLTKTVSENLISNNESVVYNLNLINRGPNVATQVSVIDVLSEAMIYTDSSTDIGNYEPITGIWTVGELGILEEVNLVIEVIVVGQDNSQIINTAVASSFEPDANLLNNTGSVNVNILVQIPTLGIWGLITLMLSFIFMVSSYKHIKRKNNR